MAEDYRRPGWYPDPQGAPGERWWNGAGWSDSRRGGASSAASAPAYHSAVGPVLQRPDPYAPSPTLATSTSPAPPRTGSAALRQNQLATVGFVTGLMSLFGLSILGPVAVVFSALGFRRARQLRTEGSGGSSAALAWIGIVGGAVGTVALVVAIVSFFAAITFEIS
jgi:hypothetical protein